MKLYKYKSLSGSLEYTLDIISSERLYCSPWKDLNDPMEGIFSYSYFGNKKGQNINKQLESVRLEKGKLRICSLSEVGNDYEAYLMWAHYADGFKGLAIELELESSDTIPVQYVPGFPHFSIKDLDDGRTFAKKVLSSKMHCWSYERERRIILPDEFFDVKGKIKKVIVGFRANETVKKLIKSICQTKNIPIFITGLGDEGVDFDLFK